MDRTNRSRLFTPGPATTTEAVKRAQLVPDICPRERAFCEVMDEVAAGITKVGHGDGSHACVMFAASGTGAVEAAVTSALGPAGRILIHANGAYGDRMIQIAHAAYGEDRVLTLKQAHGAHLDPLELDELLRDNSDVTHVALVHHETTTGMLNPAEAVLGIAQKHGVRVILDAMSSFAGRVIDLQETPFDYVISSSNKCLQGMAGLSFVLTKRSELEAIAENPVRSVYFNLWLQFRNFRDTGQMRFTPPVQVVYALRQALRDLEEETLPGRVARYERNWDTLMEGAADLELKPLLTREHQSKLLTAFHEPDWPGFSFDGLHDDLLDQEMTIYPGKISHLSTFRVANIGDLTPEDMTLLIAGMQRFRDRSQSPT